MTVSSRTATRSPIPFRSAQAGLSRLWLLIIIAAVLLLVVLGVGGYFYSHTTGESPAAAEHAEHAAPPTTPVFVIVSPMTVNLASGAQVLYIGLTLDVADQTTADRLTEHMPQIRNRLLITLSDQQADDLTTAAGKRKIARILREVLQAPYAEGAAPVAIRHVLFTDFIVQ